MFFLLQLKRAKVSRHESKLFYTSYIRSVLTYASPVFFYALPMYLKKDLESVEKRALSIIWTGLAYREALELTHIDSINDYITSLCKKTFTSIANDPAHRLHSMLPSPGPLRYNLRRKRRFVIPKCKIERFKNSFLVKNDHATRLVSNKSIYYLPLHLVQLFTTTLKCLFKSLSRFLRNSSRIWTLFIWTRKWGIVLIQA